MYVVNECWITFQPLGPQSNLTGAGGWFPIKQESEYDSNLLFTRIASFETKSV